ncbi:MAG: carbon-nitrogen hydrolase family protein [Candidatus Aminicenantaceae bacterium]
MRKNKEKKKRWLLCGLLGLFVLFWACPFLEASAANSDVVTIACVNFNTDWGNKEQNLERIKGYVTAAAKRGADIILFPELALTGYENGPGAKMHKENAETIPGPSTNALAELTRKLGVYVIVGMPEKSSEDPDVFYNSAAIIGPEGVIGSYAKLMPFGNEMRWCQKGEKPFAFDTPWGLVGVGICYDTYMFPELPRYYAALGARLYVHITALGSFKGWKPYYINQMQARAIENMMFVASSNIVGKDRTSDYPGASFVLGPGEEAHEVKFYAGPASETKEEVILATIDLAAADRMRQNYPLFRENPVSGKPDWRLELYKEILHAIGEKTDLDNYK